MKKSDLIRIIREVVKREVKSAIKEELKTPRIKKQESNGQFSSNPVLNEALQETAKEWPNMGNKTLESKDALAGRAGLAGIIGMQPPDEIFGGKPTIQQMIPDDKRHIEINPEIEQALTRDYSQLMKAIDKKKQHK